MPSRTIGDVPFVRRLMGSLTRDNNKKGRILLASLVAAMSIATGLVLTHAFQSGVAHAAGGTGATLPYVEMEAHNASTNGTIIGPSYVLGDLASDAVDRVAVQLTQGKSVTFTLTQQANAINLRYAIPDSSSGNGLNAPISIYINGVKQTNLQLTSQYAWLYGTPGFGDCNGNVWTNTPGGTAHHMFDEAHMLLPQMHVGDLVKIQVDAEDTAQWYAIDVADFEQVAGAIGQPAGSINVTSAPYNADATGAANATTAIQNAINDGSAQGKTVYIPQGKFQVTSHLMVNNVTLTGAGMWYTTLFGAPTSSTGTGVGIYGTDMYDGGNSAHVNISNLNIEGSINNRIDCIQDNGIGGSLNSSTVSSVWIEHTKVGIWVDGPFDGLNITGVRINNTTADGINFHRAVTNSSVKQSIIRSTGDDGLAMWSSTDNVSTVNANDTFDHNTVQATYLANGIAIYGGTTITVTNNIVQNTQYRGGGISITLENFGNTTSPFQGTITVSNNTVKGGGGWGDQGILQFGALMFWADSGPLNTTFNVDNDEIDNALFGAIQFDGGSSVATMNMSNINVNGAEFVFVQKVSNITGSATNITASNITVASLESCSPLSSFAVTMGTGNSGWSTSSSVCGFPNPTPNGGATATPTFVGATPTPTQIVPTATPIPPIGGTTVLAINAGGGTVSNFIADTDNTGGNAFSDTSTAITQSGLDTNPAPAAVYQDVLWNTSFTYTLPGLTAGGTYTVILHWAELSFQAAGMRTFNVAVNGNQVLTNFDVYANAGYKTALSRAFTTTANGSGQIVLAFSHGTADNPFINAIEVKSSTGPTPTPAPPTATPTSPTATPTTGPATATPTTPAGLTLVKAINAGGAATGSYVADTNFDQGNTFSDTSTAITIGSLDPNPAPGAVYQSVRWNPTFTYTIPSLVAGRTYTVRLHFAELSFQAAGMRKFNVAINGTNVLSAFDVFATAGYKTAVGRTFTTTANGSGQVVIAFTQGGADNPMVSGIEILQASGQATATPAPPTATPTGPTLVKAINAGGAASGSYVADTNFDTGNQFSDTSTGIGTSGDPNPAPQAVYQTVRWAPSFTYTIPGLTAGSTYTVRLHFAELSFQAAGMRKFNVAINGTNVLSAFDVYATAGYKNAVARSYTATANASGQIVIAFTQGGADNPMVSGIEILH